MQFGKFGKPLAVHRCLGVKGLRSTELYDSKASLFK